MQLRDYYSLLPFISAQSVGIVSSLKRMATSIKGGESTLVITFSCNQ